MKYAVYKVVLVIVFILSILFIISTHYVESGECVERVYYYPLETRDYAIIIFIGIIVLFSSLHYIMTNKFQRWIECSIYCTIIIITIVFGNSILASRTIEWPDTYKVSSIENKPSENILSEYIENNDSIYNIVEELIARHLNSEKYSYRVWETKAKELVGVETCTHFNDYNYLGHEINILDYLNWHLLKRISLHLDSIQMNEIRMDIVMADSLLYAQYDFLDVYFSHYSTRYDNCGMCIEQKNIINENLQDIYIVITEGISNFYPRKITQMDNYPYECPDVDDDIIEKEYQRFSSECIPMYNDEPRSPLEIKQVTSRLDNEHKLWKRFIANRNSVETNLSGNLKRVWAYATKVWKLNKLRQLKNEFECYGTMSELDYQLSLHDCNYTELMNYTNYSTELERTLLNNTEQ